MTSCFIYLFSLFLSVKVYANEIENDSLDIGTVNRHEVKQLKDNYYEIPLIHNKEYIDNNYISISTTSNKAAHIYASFKIKFPTYQASTFKSFAYKNNTLYIPYQQVFAQSILYICIHCSEIPCEYNITAIYEKDITFKEENKEISLFVPNGESNIEVKINNEMQSKYIIYVLSSNMMEIKNDFVSNDKVKFDKVYSNGIGTIIDNSIITDKEINAKFIVSRATNVIIGKRNVEKEYNNVGIMEIMTGMINKEDTITFKVNNDDIELLEGEEEIKDFYVLNFLSHIEGLSLDLINPVSGEIVKSEEVKANNFVLFSKQELYNNVITFYHKKEKDEDTTISTIGFQFQIVDSSKVYEHQDFYSPIIPGVTHRYYLKRNQVIYHHLTPKFYYTPKYKMILKIKSGDPVLYGMSCDNIVFNCQVKSEKISELRSQKMISTTRVINSFYHVTINTYSTEEPKEYVALVHCQSEEEDCSYTITISIDETKIKLRNEHKLVFFVKKDDVDYFTFNVYKKNLEKVEVVLFSFSGKAEMISNNTQYGDNVLLIPENIGNKNTDIYYRRDVIEKSNQTFPLDGEYIVKITGISSSYYSIHYVEYTKYTYNIYEIQKGVTTSDYLSSNVPMKIFTFKNFRSGEDVSYLIKIFSYNCIVNITLEDEISYQKVNNFQLEITKDMSIFNNSTYRLKVEKANEDAKYTQCTLRISNDEISNKQEMILNEGISYNLYFNKRITNFTFIYPYWFEGYGQSLLATLTSYSFGDIFYKYSIEGGEFTKAQALSRTKKLIITSYELEQKCFIGYLCSIIFHISVNPEILKKEDDDYSIYFRILISSTNKIPQYLPKEFLHIGRVFEEKDQFFYTDISQNELTDIVTTGKIYVNFLRGSGMAIAKLVPNVITELNPDWNHRVELPNVNTKNRLPCDYYDNAIYFNSTHLEKCINGCELYIAVISGEVGSHLYSEFSILIHTTNVVQLINPNEYIFGNLYIKSHTVNEYINYKVDYDCDSLDILFHCYGCYMNLQLSFPQYEGVFLWNITNSFRMSVNDEIFKDIKVQSFYQASLKGEVIPVYFSDLYNTKYSFQVLMPEKKVNKKVIRRESPYDEPCKIRSEDEFCYYIVPIFDYDYLTKLIMYSEYNSKLDQHSQIFVNVFDSEQFENFISENITEYLPNKEKNDFSSLGGYLSITNKEYSGFIKDGYYLVSFKPGVINKDVNLLMSHYMSPVSTILIPNLKNIFYISSSDKPLSIKTYGNYSNQYLVEFFWIEGTGSIAKDGIDYYPLNENQQYLSFIVNYHEQLSQEEINEIPANIPLDIRKVRGSSRDESLILYTKYKIIGYTKNSDPYIKMIHNNKRNKYVFSNETIFPFLYYVKSSSLFENSDEVLINYNMVFYEDYRRYEGKVFFVDRDTLQSLKEGVNNITNISLENYCCSLKTMSTFDTSYLRINKQDISNPKNNYMLLWIDTPFSHQKHNLTYFDVNILLYDVNQCENLMEYQKLYMSEVRNKDINCYIVSNNTNIDKYFEIVVFPEEEISINMTNLKGEQSSMKETTNKRTRVLVDENIDLIKIKEIENITYIVVSYTEALKVEITNTKSNLTKYLIVHHSLSNPDIEHPVNDKKELHFHNIKYNSNQFIFKPLSTSKTKYLLTLYNQSVLEQSTDMNTLLFNENSSYSYSFIRYKEAEIAFDAGRIEVGKYYAVLVGIKDDIDFVFYNVIPITVERKESDYVWLYSLIFVLILCCGVFIFFVCKKKRSAINERTSSFIDETTNSISSQMEIQNDEDSNDSSEKQKGFIQSDESSK